MFKSKNGNVIDVEELDWAQARLLLEPLDLKLVNIIDEISPSKDYKLYKAKYPFGTQIINRASSFLSLNNGQTISFNDPDLPSNLFKNLSYDPAISNPVGIVLNKYSEFFITIGDRVMPYMVMSPGHIFGLTRILDNLEIKHVNSPFVSFFMWELTSGTRSIFMLPKITENLSYSKLKNIYHLSREKPDTYKDHWFVFKELAIKRNSPWRSEFLYFSNKWFEKLGTDEWSKLYSYFLSKNRLAYRFWHNILSWEVAINQSKNLRYSQYALETAKHLFAIGTEALPGFKPATDDKSAPIELIQDSYIEGYGLRDYWPIIMEASNFDLDISSPVYYSLNYPTLAQYNPHVLKGKSIIALLDELRVVIEKYQEAIQNHPIAKDTSVYKILNRIDFSYYHSDPSHYQGIKNDSYIPFEDPRFVYTQEAGNFPIHSFFLKGCVKIVCS